MSAELQPNPPPDWSTLDKDLHCPLCEYNLRGLAESRCPECGFAFTWAELLDALKNKHPYLFEYGRGRNVKTLCKTWWRTSLPRRFWREVNPAQDVKVGRLILYWVIASLIIAGLFVIPMIWPACQAASAIYRVRAGLKSVPNQPGYLLYVRPDGSQYVFAASTLDYRLPMPWRARFWDVVSIQMRQNGYRNRELQSLQLGFGIIFLMWPGSTLISLLIFRLSMRQAKIRTSHVVRAVIYSCDFGLLILLVATLMGFLDTPYKDGWLWVVMAVVCALITTYRLTIAFKQYLRVHLPFATVVASQLISFLIVFILLLQIADFTRRI